MKRVVKESTTITEMIEDDEGKRFIINRKHNVNVSTEPVEGSLPGLQVIEKDKYFREEIAKEAEEYKKNNPSSQKEKELPDTNDKGEDIPNQYDKVANNEVEKFFDEYRPLVSLCYDTPSSDI
ncbi:4265_t:CDS:2 [Ambispora leptoticha]|uniref:4265_t:CDS:1 n=1 Tax=Ambispora leptoticha TaxID=144679 RepID=A0A9N9ICG5_9GLOM|nr:4265_t:CDS:2 [Ambispora leptoticha]